jgi:hypothetical protein
MWMKMQLPTLLISFPQLFVIVYTVLFGDMSAAGVADDAGYRLIISTPIHYVGNTTNIFIDVFILCAELSLIFLATINFRPIANYVSSYSHTLGAKIHACSFIGGSSEHYKSHIVLIWLVCPILLPAVIHYTIMPVYWPRYTIAALPAAFILFAVGIDRPRNRYLRYCLVALLTIILTTSLPGYTMKTYL